MIKKNNGFSVSLTSDADSYLQFLLLTSYSDNLVCLFALSNAKYCI